MSFSESLCKSNIKNIFKRERDHNTNWYDASDGTMERGDYLLRNWRGDTAAVLTDGGNIVEYAKYSAYGTVKGIPAGDCEGGGAVGNDGDVDTFDFTTWANWFSTSTYDVRGDLDLDGDLDINDYNLMSSLGGNTLGRGVLSLVGIRSGYAGYQIDPAITTMYHVRARKFSTELGRFLSRDLKGYIDGLSMYEYVRSGPVRNVDPSGQAATCRVLFGFDSGGDGGCGKNGSNPNGTTPTKAIIKCVAAWDAGNCALWAKCIAVELGLNGRCRGAAEAVLIAECRNARRSKSQRQVRAVDRALEAYRTCLLRRPLLKPGEIDPTVIPECIRAGLAGCDDKLAACLALKFGTQKNARICFNTCALACIPALFAGPGYLACLGGCWLACSTNLTRLCYIFDAKCRRAVKRGCNGQQWGIY